MPRQEFAAQLGFSINTLHHWERTSACRAAGNGVFAPGKKTNSTLQK
jgi:hypothetical protein